MNCLKGMIGKTCEHYQQNFPPRLVRFISSYSSSSAEPLSVFVPYNPMFICPIPLERP